MSINYNSQSDYANTEVNYQTDQSDDANTDPVAIKGSDAIGSSVPSSDVSSRVPDSPVSQIR